MHLGRVITSPRCTVGRVNPSSSAFYQSKGRVDGSLDEPMDVLHVFHKDTWTSEWRPERVRLCVHTTQPTGPVPEPFHCDHIARWSARSGTTGRSGTGVNTGARLRSGTVPVPNLWCEHGLRTVTESETDNDAGRRRTN